MAIVQAQLDRCYLGKWNFVVLSAYVRADNYKSQVAVPSGFSLTVGHSFDLHRVRLLDEVIPFQPYVSPRFRYAAPNDDSIFHRCFIFQETSEDFEGSASTFNRRSAREA